jgi:hypothetical protein
MQSGTAYQLPPLVPYTPEIAFGLLPTPNATAFKGGRLSPRRGKANPERNNFQDFCSLVLGMRYPLPEFSEPIMGFSPRLDVASKHRALGNTVYPQIPQIIGEAIMGRIADLRAWQDEADFTWTHTGPFGDVD